MDDLKMIFPTVNFEFFPRKNDSMYNWYFCAKNLTETAIDDLKAVLKIFTRTLWIESPLDCCFALGWHSKRQSAAGKPILTALGQWVHMSKSYGSEPSSKGDIQIANLISEQMVFFIKLHPLYRQADGIVTVPPSNPEKTFDLPSVLAQAVQEECGIPFLKKALYKKRITAQMKYCLRLEDKIDNITGSVGTHEAYVEGKRVVVLDDIFDSGSTLTETAKSLRQAGVKALFGLTATKTLRTRSS